MKHHRTFGGAAWVWLHSTADQNKAVKTIAALEGVEEVLAKMEAAERFHLMPERSGDLIV